MTEHITARFKLDDREIVFLIPLILATVLVVIALFKLLLPPRGLTASRDIPTRQAPEPDQKTALVTTTSKKRKEAEAAIRDESSQLLTPPPSPRLLPSSYAPSLSPSPSSSSSSSLRQPRNFRIFGFLNGIEEEVDEMPDELLAEVLWGDADTQEALFGDMYIDHAAAGGGGCDSGYASSAAAGESRLGSFESGFAG